MAAHAGVVELVDAPDSKSGSARSVGSTPTTRTILLRPYGLRRTEAKPADVRYLAYTFPIFTTSKSAPVTWPSSLFSRPLFQPSAGAPLMYQFEPLSATIMP